MPCRSLLTRTSVAFTERAAAQLLTMRKVPLLLFIPTELQIQKREAVRCVLQRLQ